MLSPLQKPSWQSRNFKESTKRPINQHLKQDAVLGALLFIYLRILHIAPSLENQLVKNSDTLKRWITDRHLFMYKSAFNSG